MRKYWIRLNIVKVLHFSKKSAMFVTIENCDNIPLLVSLFSIDYFIFSSGKINRRKKSVSFRPEQSDVTLSIWRLKHNLHTALSLSHYLNSRLKSSFILQFDFLT